MAVHIEKPFDSVNHNFVFEKKKKNGFGSGFIKFINILIKNRNHVLSMMVKQHHILI